MQQSWQSHEDMSTHKHSCTVNTAKALGFKADALSYLSSFSAPPAVCCSAWGCSFLTGLDVSLSCDVRSQTNTHPLGSTGQKRDETRLQELFIPLAHFPKGNQMLRHWKKERGRETNRERKSHGQMERESVLAKDISPSGIVCPTLMWIPKQCLSESL